MKPKDYFSDLLHVSWSSLMLIVVLLVGKIHWDMKWATDENLCVSNYLDYPFLLQFFIN